MRFLIVGEGDYPEHMSNTLTAAGHNILSVPSVEEAKEALVVQRFDAILLSPSISAEELNQFKSIVKQFESKPSGSARAAVLCIEPEASSDRTKQERVAGLDGSVPASVDPQSLTETIVKLAAALRQPSFPQAASAEPELPILEIEGLKEQVAYDDELLVELIDLYFTERSKQSIEMQNALSAGDFERLSAVAHTIKGSLASLHAMNARASAQSLESAAKQRDPQRCRELLPRLEQDLNVLEGHLLAVKRSVNGA